MEPGVKEFLQRLVLSIFTALLWMLINSTAGIMFGHAFIEHKLSVGNIIFYAWFLTSLVFLIRFYYRLWSKPIEKD
jgi:membrane protein DedA with SNARE-associated domain